MFGYPNDQVNTAYGHGQAESPLSPIGRDRDILQDRLYDTDPRERSRFDPLASPSTISGRFSYPSALESPRSTLQSPNEKTRFIPNTQPTTPATPTIKRWPNEPKRLKRNDAKSWNFWYEIIRFIAALGFVAFGTVAYAFKEKDLETCLVCKGIVTTCSYVSLPKSSWSSIHSLTSCRPIAPDCISNRLYRPDWRITSTYCARPRCQRHPTGSHRTGKTDF